MELDTHADTCCLGKVAEIVSYTGKYCEVSGFSDSLNKLTDIPIITGAVAVDSPSGNVLILQFHQALYLGENLEGVLMCPNQVRSNGLVVDDCPRHLSANKSSTHSIHDPASDRRLPLKLRGVISYINVRKPTREEIESCDTIHMTEEREWNPYDSSFQEQEEAATLNDEYVVEDFRGSRTILSTSSQRESRESIGDQRMLASVSKCLNNEEFLKGLVDNVRVQTDIQGRSVQATRTSNRQVIQAEELAKRWGIGVKTAINTLKVTTQRGVRHPVHPLARRYRTKQNQLRRNQLSCTVYSDTFFATTPSVRGNTCAQIFVTDSEFPVVFPMRKKGEAYLGLDHFIADVGIPSVLHTDGAKELTQGKWRETVKDCHIVQTEAEAYSPFMNRAEKTIGELKKDTRREISRKRAPKSLWDFAAVWRAELRQVIAYDNPNLRGRNGYEFVTGNTRDISEYLDFDWYDYAWFWDELEQFPGEKRKLCRWLGVSHRVGQAMCYWVLPKSGKPISRSSVQPVTPQEMETEQWKNAKDELDKQIFEAIGDKAVKTKDDDGNLIFKPHDDVPNFMRDEDDEFEPMEPEAAMPEADDIEFTIDAFDKYIGAEVGVSKGGVQFMGTVIRRKRDVDGKPQGMSNNNPMLDTRRFEVRLSDGTMEEYDANTIAESMYSQVDDEGKSYILLDEIVDHRSDGHAVKKADMYITSKGGNRHIKPTTRGWKLCISWKDGSTSWENLKDLKESYPVQVAEYATACGIADEPAFAWWTKTTLKRRDRIISKVKSRFLKKTHKFGIRVPNTIEEAYAIDEATGTDFWVKAIEKEMKNVLPAFKFMEKGEKAPYGSKWIPCHLIFDIKMDLTRKARYVAGGHRTDPPAASTFSTVVSRESVRIAFLIAALNDLDVLAADVGNAYINAECAEKVHTTAGLEFGPEHKGTILQIVRALYGLKSSGKSWHQHLSKSMLSLGFLPCKADGDVWMRKATKPDGFRYWEYVLCYVDDILTVSHDPQSIMKQIKAIYRLKDGIAPPEVYLGANISQHYHPGDEKPRWAMSSDDYVKEALRNVEQTLKESGQTLSNKAETPMTTNYHPELDATPVLDDNEANYYQAQIGVLRWACELGRVDILLEVSLLSSYTAQPRAGHLDQLLHIFAYLKKHKRSKVVFDDTSPVFSETRFKEVDWTDQYGDIKEAIPPDAPEALGNSVHQSCFVDADHAGNRVTRRSHTGILMFLNRAPITWFSKRQATVETSTFGSEFVAMRIAVEMIEGLRYKLRMMGIPLDGPASVFCDNNSVVINASTPESQLKKKHNAIAYHRVREACAAKTIRIAKEGTATNLSDLFTKMLPQPRRKKLLVCILY
jgi:hypothetical protein